METQRLIIGFALIVFLSCLWFVKNDKREVKSNENTIKIFTWEKIILIVSVLLVSGLYIYGFIKFAHNYYK